MTNLEKSLNKRGRRKNSVAVIGALYGDEGKGRITDNLTTYFLENFKEVIVYRDNGGANAGHTVSVGDKKIGLHQIGSGILHKGCTVILGKGMVIHPIDLVAEIEEIKKVFGFKQLPASLKIDEMATLSLDTHRAFEQALKERDTGKMGSAAATGRGISPAYSDILYRFPLRIKDFMSEGWEDLFRNHYDMYGQWIQGMNQDMSKMLVKRFKKDDTVVGSVEDFIENLKPSREVLKKYCENIYEYVRDNWEGDTPFVFEKAQAVGLDYRWGMYPDITASNCCLDGITYSTEGAVDANKISARIGVIKSTYTSSVGKRVLPTEMEENFAHEIREDANEYGTTTGRPRDIAYMDLVMLKYFCEVSGIEELAFTHMDIVYERDIKVCISYKRDSKKSYYRPDMEFLSKVKPVYKNFKSWKRSSLSKLKTIKDGEKSMIEFMDYISKKSNTTPVVITYGPKRDDILTF